ncbi:MAG TPA: ABC transporter substrate-binding protein [Longimicrobium sp.]|uniref:ABC transporter substrate-binding protein n=1 Tax=Longimicrobium sp. TaxID=2029185 RepID=UPI002EDA353E
MNARYARTALAALLVAALTACGGGGGGGGADQGGKGKDAGTPQQGGTGVLDVLTDFQAFNPVTNTALTTDDVIKHMLFTPLIQYDEKLNPKPWLAERWDLTDTAVVFHLRRDVKWHDGKPVTAEDVKFTFDLAKDSATASLLGSAYVNMIRSATVVDPYTIRFGFVAPHAQALDAFWWPPLPKHLLGSTPAGQLSTAPFNRNPVGSGPFKFAEWKPSQSVTFEANPAFPEALGGRPNLDRVVFRIVPEATTMVTELVNGTADMIGYTLLPDQAKQISGQRGLELRHYPSREFTFLAWNNTRPLFSDTRVRRALTMGIDRQQLINGLLQGFGQPATGIIPAWSPMYTPLQPLPFDPAGARALLQQAGWTDTNRDGFVDKGGQPLRFVLTINSANRSHGDIAQVVQRQLKAIGVDLQIRPQEFQSMLQQYKAREYDAVLANWSLDTFKVDPSPLFSCAQARVKGSANRTGYCNEQGDRLAEEAMRSTDPARAKQLWAQWSQLLQQDQPVTFLWWSEDLAGLGPRVRNVQTDARSKIVNIADWWVRGR